MKAKPKEICFLCKKVIFNKMKSAKYCNQCDKPVEFIRIRVSSVMYRARKKFPNFKFRYDLNINKK